MPRALFALLVVGAALSFVVGAGTASGRATSATDTRTDADTKIILRARQGGHGAWRRYLWLKLDRSQVTSFSVCGIWNRTSAPPPNCRAARRTRLPEGTILRLEQRRPGRGWKTVGTSTEAALQAVLSNTVSGNRLGTVAYRVTWRNAGGRVRGTSNTLRVIWHR